MSEKAKSIKLGAVVEKQSKDGFYLRLDKYTTLTLTRKNKDGSSDKIVLDGEDKHCLSMFKNDGTGQTPDFVKYDVVAFTRE